ncbi:hypothetical protein ACOMHN_053172 [Nucella lapillus]
MSFPKAEVKRFNDIKGCAPPVGAYDPKNSTKAAGGVIEKSERFKHPKDMGDSLQQDSVLSVSNPSLCSTPIKQHHRSSNTSSSSESLAQSVCKKSATKKVPAQVGEHLARVKELELEIRRLVREKGDKDGEMRRLRQEQERLEGRLGSANAERSSCLARTARLEQEVRDAKRGLEVLHKQVSTTESSGRKKEERLREEVQSLQGQIHSKEQEIHSTQKQIVAALLALVTDAKQCAKHSEGLNQLFCRLELNIDMSESEDEEKGSVSSSESGFKHINSQIKCVRRYIRRVSSYVSKLAECGVEGVESVEGVCQSVRVSSYVSKLAECGVEGVEGLCQSVSVAWRVWRVCCQSVIIPPGWSLQRVSSYISKLAECGVEGVEGLQSRLVEEHAASLQQLSHQLDQAQVQHRHLQDQLTQQQHSHELHLAQSLQQQRQEQCHTMQQENDCEEAHQRLEQTLEECSALQSRLQQSEEGQRSMQQDRDALQRSLTRELEDVERRLKAEQEALQQKLTAECAAMESRLQESREGQEREVGELQESCRHTQEKLDAVREELRHKEARLDELENCLRVKQTEHEAASQALQTDLEQLQQRLQEAERDLQQKHTQHDLAMQQLQQLQQAERNLQEQLQESEASGRSLQEQLQEMQQEELQLKELVNTFRKTRDNLDLEKEAARKELELKGDLLNEALQALKGEAYLTSDTGTPTRTTQVLFEERAHKAAVQEHMQEIEQENKILNCSIQSITAKYQSSIQDLEVTLGEERKRSSQMSTRFCVSEEERQTMSEELSHTQLVNRDLMESISVFKDQVCSLKASSSQLRQQLEQGKVTTTSLRDTIHNLQDTVQDLNKQLGQERTTHTHLQAGIQDLTQQLADQQTARSDLEVTIKDLTEQLEEEQRTTTDQEVTIKGLTEKLEDRQTAVSDLEGTITDLEVTIPDLRQQLEDSQSAVTDLEAAVKSLELRVEEEQQAADTACREANVKQQQLEVENKQHQIANEALKGQLTHLTDRYNKETTELKDRCHSLQEERQGQKHQEDLQSVRKALDMYLQEERQRQGQKHQEDLQSVRKALALDRQANDLHMEELALKLDRAHAFNAQLKDDMKKLLKDQEKLRDDSRAEMSAMQLKVDIAEAQVTEATSQSELLHHQAKHAQREWLRLKTTVGELEACLSSKEEELAGERSTLDECRSHLDTQQSTLTHLQAERDALQEHLHKLSGEYSVLETDLERQVGSLQAAALEERAEYERMMSEMSEKIQQLEEEQSAPDSDEWREKYEQLFARVEPFMEQLDAFAAERNLLVGHKETAEAEMAKMMDKYARLLGHQNQRQKIQYVNKMKDDYMQCRKEKEALKEKAGKMQATIQKLEKKVQSLEDRKTCDPTQGLRRKEDGGRPGFKAAVRQEDVVRSPLKQSESGRQGGPGMVPLRSPSRCSLVLLSQSVVSALLFTEARGWGLSIQV